MSLAYQDAMFQAHRRPDQPLLLEPPVGLDLGGFMLNNKLANYLTAAAFAVALIAIPAITGSSTAAAQPWYQGRDFGRERGYYDDDIHDHQRREKNRQKRHERLEREDLRVHQAEERYHYGDSDELRDHQEQEREELKQHNHEEKHDLRHHQRSERDDYYDDRRYRRDDRFYRDGYYDEDGNFRRSRRSRDGYFGEYDRYHSDRRRY